MGGSGFDEAHTAPWRSLRFPGHPFLDSCFSTALEYRGQMDVSDAIALADAKGRMALVADVGVVTSDLKPQHSVPEDAPLAGAVEFMAPMGGMVSWITSPGDRVEEGQVLGRITDPTLRRRLPITAPSTGILFRQDLWTSCLKGQGFALWRGKKNDCRATRCPIETNMKQGVT